MANATCCVDVHSRRWSIPYACASTKARGDTEASRLDAPRVRRVAGLGLDLGLRIRVGVDARIRRVAGLSLDLGLHLLRLGLESEGGADRSSGRRASLATLLAPASLPPVLADPFPRALLTEVSSVGHPVRALWTSRSLRLPRARSLAETLRHGVVSPRGALWPRPRGTSGSDERFIFLGRDERPSPISAGRAAVKFGTSCRPRGVRPTSRRAASSARPPRGSPPRLRFRARCPSPRPRPSRRRARARSRPYHASPLPAPVLLGLGGGAPRGFVILGSVPSSSARTPPRAPPRPPRTPRPSRRPRLSLIHI